MMALDRLIWNIVIDFLTLGCVALPLLLLTVLGEPHERGYFQNDESIRLPLKPETVSEGALAGGGFAIVIVSIIGIEMFRDRRGKGIGEKYMSGALVPGWVWESYRAIGVYTFGAACQQLSANMAKYILGRLRPHFYDVCRPLANSTSPLNELGYIIDYTCQTNDSRLIKNARLSFPSAHSSYAIYSALYLIFYIQTKAKWRGSKLLRHGIQFAALMGAWYVGISRVVDHYHHWSDVAAGFVNGTVFAVLTFVYILRPKKYGLPSSWQGRPQEGNVQNELSQPALAR
ncbi:putative phosphatidate phosphatase [Achroia grisella]|uniref:putative phosphatidate phosphatase n=1 Tax=Achroia grisella TaxID=688607 RepID=UPI0027D324BD|nr:putative phosphatidate phosphatase [Achroia grisella]